MTAPAPVERFRRTDWLLLAGFALVLYGVAAWSGRSLSTHEAVHCENVREMLVDGDMVIPHYGGRPWLERPPLPHWITAAVASIDRHAEWPYRLSAALAGTLVVVLVGWMASVWYGRGVGLLAGATLATTREHFMYSCSAESDMFLAALVAAATALFVRAEFVSPEPDERVGFFGRRRWVVFALFAALGMENLAKGPFFGQVLTLVPIAGYLLGQFAWRPVARYVWLWGWLAFAACAAAWPVAALLREPGVADLWAADLFARVGPNGGAFTGAPWYYAIHLPAVLFPWTPIALVGLWFTARQARDPRSPERFLLCWAVLPVLLLSVPDGKHHHYLLSVMAPWAILSAVAAQRVWAWLRSFPRWMQSPLTTAALVAVVGGVVLSFRDKLPNTDRITLSTASTAELAALLAGIILYAGVVRWAIGLANPARAAAFTCCLIGLALWAGEVVTTATDGYPSDRRFVRGVPECVPAGVPLLVLNDMHPLDASWMLFYLPDRTPLLHNPTFLLDDSLREPEVYLVARGYMLTGLDLLGTVEMIARSERSRSWRTDPFELWTLVRFRPRPDLKRYPAVPVSPAQAAGRVDGPSLTPKVAVTQAR